ncbi:MAG: succinate dehydrogenase, hydrophobic membrane anchor protein [Sulfuricella sp.]|nr:succinate dehydrogenase, hydrophobic membrane anchor protein [Sulfuricella sp.]
MVNRIVTGAHYGLRDWLMQRITAVVMVVYLVALAGFLLTHQPLQYADWHAFFECELVRLGTILFMSSLFLHAWVGVRDILMDYLKPVGLRLTAEVLTIVVLIAYAAWSIQILWGIK